MFLSLSLAIQMGSILRTAAAAATLLLAVAGLLGAATATVGDKCSRRSTDDCGAGQWCFDCEPEFDGSHCVRSTATNTFKLINDSLPFNKYAYLTTHNSFAIVGEPSHTGIPRITFDNQEDTVTDQLNNGVRALMLDTYDFKGDVWLCHSSGGKCNDFTAFEPALDTFMEIEVFLSANPSEIVTLILEDYVNAPNGLTNVFNASGLHKYWFPVSRMPQNGQDWPLVSDMVASGQRLLVFTSMRSKQATEGIAYQWNFMVENNYGDDGMDAGKCSNRAESAPLDDKTKSLVLMNYFPSVPVKLTACLHHSESLTDMVNTCYGAAGNRWANFIAVDYYKRSQGGGVFQDTDLLNGRLLCGCQDVNACLPPPPPAAGDDDEAAAAGRPRAPPHDVPRQRGRRSRSLVALVGAAAHGGAGGGVVRVQHRRAPPQQVPPLRLRLPLPGLPHRLPHVRLRAPLLPPRRRHQHHQDLLPAAQAALARAGGQGGRAGRRLLRLRRRRQRLATLPPGLLQPGRRRHHALLHRAHRLRRRRPPRGRRHLRRPRPRRRRRRHRHRGRAELPPVRLRHVRRRHGREGAQDRAAGDPALLRRGEAQLHGPAPVHGAGGHGPSSAGDADHGARSSQRGGGAGQGGPQLRLDAALQLLAGIPGEPDQLPGHQAHQPAHDPGPRERERRGRRRGFHPHLQEPGDRHGHAGLRGHHRRRDSLRRGQEEEQVSSAWEAKPFSCSCSLSALRRCSPQPDESIQVLAES